MKRGFSHLWVALRGICCSSDRKQQVPRAATKAWKFMLYRGGARNDSVKGIAFSKILSASSHSELPPTFRRFMLSTIALTLGSYKQLAANPLSGTNADF